MCRERLLSHIFGLTTTSKSFNPVPGRSERPESSVGRSLLGDVQGRWVLWWPQGPVSNSDTKLGNVTSALPSGDISMQLLPGDFPQPLLQALPQPDGTPRMVSLSSLGDIPLSHPTWAQLWRLWGKHLLPEVLNSGVWFGFFHSLHQQNPGTFFTQRR